MRHSNSGKKLGRTPSHRKALFRNMASAMITYGKIRTTEVKARTAPGGGTSDHLGPSQRSALPPSGL